MLVAVAGTPACAVVSTVVAAPRKGEGVEMREEKKGDEMKEEKNKKKKKKVNRKGKV